MNKEAFQELIALAIRSKGKDFVTALRSAFGVAASTVSRWSIGTACPHEWLREPIAQWVWERL